MQGGGLSIATDVVILVAFFLFVGVVGHYRLKLDAALQRLPPDLRDYLGLEGSGGSPRRRRRALADRLTIYGLPGWMPLGDEGSHALARLRLVMLAFLMVIAFGPALAYFSVWGLFTLPIVLAVIGVRAIAVGPWPQAPDGTLVTRRHPPE